ncbi:MAG TPA: glycoside hydrolase family 44 protein [Ideonella sp.]|uniref:glycoside hydrolase family 44 protein n=1 Tax=Ideonella sp. TaxID=1929293 RepID=UPI002E3766F8|nr:glycoside hydrolase family 44 protein [Ideonella sp.]HEX5688317.1 glycoside hydrolase family 44 protein [Ideonella sp.]
MPGRSLPPAFNPLHLLAAASLCALSATTWAATGPAVTIDATADNHVISNYIYGMNFAPEALAKELKLPVRRWGGNRTTRYNWKIDVDNTGSDWYFENIPNPLPTDGRTLPDGSAADKFVEQDRRTGTQTLMTLPMTGWVAKRRPPNDSHPFDCGFKVSVYGAQQSVDPWDTNCGNGVKTNGTNITGNNPTDTSVAVGTPFVQDWVRHLIANYGNANNGGVKFYNLDNEPELWRHTHRDIRPQPLSYDELRDRTWEYAAAVKAVDPGAQTLGPSGWGWTAYFYSDLDTAPGGDWWNHPLDRNAHGGVPHAEWYLQQMKAYEQQHGKRILDYLDEHYYPQANGVFSNNTDAATNALRLRSTRSLWDPTYTDESWIADKVNLIPRMRSWVANNYPGTKLAISEYSWGAVNHINGALAQADVLGIFGRERLDLATLWSPPDTNDAVAFAFRMYLNVDGKGGRFGAYGVRATSADQSKLSVYASRRGKKGAMTLIAVNKSGTPLSSKITLNHFAAGAHAKVYRYSPANLSAIQHLANTPVTAGVINAELPADSITMYVVPVAAAAN